MKNVAVRSRSKINCETKTDFYGFR